MGDYLDEGEYWAGQKYHPSESGMATSGMATSDIVAAPPPEPTLPVVVATPEVVNAGEGDCYIKQKPLEAWLAATFPKSAFATRMAAPTPCVAKEPVAEKSVVFACP